MQLQVALALLLGAAAADIHPAHHHHNGISDYPGDMYPKNMGLKVVPSDMDEMIATEMQSEVDPGTPAPGQSMAEYRAMQQQAASEREAERERRRQGRERRRAARRARRMAEYMTALKSLPQNSSALNRTNALDHHASVNEMLKEMRGVLHQEVPDVERPLLKRLKRTLLMHEAEEEQLEDKVSDKVRKAREHLRGHLDKTIRNMMMETEERMEWKLANGKFMKRAVKTAMRKLRKELRKKAREMERKMKDKLKLHCMASKMQLANRVGRAVKGRSRGELQRLRAMLVNRTRQEEERLERELKDEVSSSTHGAQEGLSADMQKVSQRISAELHEKLKEELKAHEQRLAGRVENSTGALGKQLGELLKANVGQSVSQAENRLLSSLRAETKVHAQNAADRLRMDLNDQVNQKFTLATAKATAKAVEAARQVLQASGQSSYGSSKPTLLESSTSEGTEVKVEVPEHLRALIKKAEQERAEHRSMLLQEARFKKHMHHRA